MLLRLVSFILLVGVNKLIRLSVVLKIGVHFMNFTNTIKTYDQASHRFPMASLLYDFTFRKVLIAVALWGGFPQRKVAFVFSLMCLENSKFHDRSYNFFYGSFMF